MMERLLGIVIGTIFFLVGLVILRQIILELLKYPNIQVNLLEIDFFMGFAIVISAMGIGITIYFRGKVSSAVSQ